MSSSFYAQSNLASYDRFGMKGIYSRAAVPQYASPGSHTAFNAHSRLDPFSRERHISTLSAVGRTPGLPRQDRNLFGSGVIVPDRWPGSWEYEIALRSLRSPLVLSPLTSTDRPAGAAQNGLGVFSLDSPPPPHSQHYPRLTSKATEEEKRQFLLTGERGRRHADQRWQPTNTLGTRSSLNAWKA